MKKVNVKQVELPRPVLERLLAVASTFDPETPTPSHGRQAFAEGCVVDRVRYKFSKAWKEVKNSPAQKVATKMLCISVQADPGYAELHGAPSPDRQIRWFAVEDLRKLTLVGCPVVEEPGSKLTKSQIVSM